MFVEAVDQRCLAESCSGSVDASPGKGWEKNKEDNRCAEQLLNGHQQTSRADAKLFK